MVEGKHFPIVLNPSRVASFYSSALSQLGSLMNGGGEWRVVSIDGVD